MKRSNDTQLLPGLPQTTLWTSPQPQQKTCTKAAAQSRPPTFFTTQHLAQENCQNCRLATPLFSRWRAENHQALNKSCTMRSSGHSLGCRSRFSHVSAPLSEKSRQASRSRPRANFPKDLPRKNGEQIDSCQVDINFAPSKTDRDGEFQHGSTYPGNKTTFGKR